MSLRIGIDVGGTNTDAVLMDDLTVVAKIKTPTTEDVTSGITTALRHVLETSGTATDADRRGDDRHHPLHQRRRRAPPPAADRRRPPRPAGHRRPAADGRLAGRSGARPSAATPTSATAATSSTVARSRPSTPDEIKRAAAEIAAKGITRRRRLLRLLPGQRRRWRSGPPRSSQRTSPDVSRHPLAARSAGSACWSGRTPPS